MVQIMIVMITTMIDLDKKLSLMLKVKGVKKLNRLILHLQIYIFEFDEWKCIYFFSSPLSHLISAVIAVLKRNH